VLTILARCFGSSRRSMACWNKDREKPCVCGRPQGSTSDKLDHNEEVVFTRLASHGTSTVHADSWVYGEPPSRSAQSMLPTHNSSYIATGPGRTSARKTCMCIWPRSSRTRRPGDEKPATRRRWRWWRGVGLESWKRAGWRVCSTVWKAVRLSDRLNSGISNSR